MKVSIVPHLEYKRMQLHGGYRCAGSCLDETSKDPLDGTEAAVG
jgi:hypothetical protein